MTWNYESLSEIAKQVTLPAMFVNLDVLVDNAKLLANVAKSNQKNLRLASKSIRVVELIKKVIDVDPEVYKGVMCFSSAEAKHLMNLGLDDFLVAYPVIQKGDIENAAEVYKAKKKITLMTDDVRQLATLSALWKETGVAEPLRVCMDLDMSYRPANSSIHLGVRRSPIRTVLQTREFHEVLKSFDNLQLVGVMGYEAQIAGLPDRNPVNRMLNGPKALIKRLSVPEIAKRRKQIADYFAETLPELEFFNGGGTGSLKSTVKEPWLTEVTAGSGFLQSQLFDYYKDALTKPAFCFGLVVTRQPSPNIVTCHSGGFIASGEVSLDKQPVPWLPAGLTPISTEGFGEVQTPLVCQSQNIPNIGDPIFFRPAKAGEIAERFNEYHLIENGALVGSAKTYRGEGFAFY